MATMSLRRPNALAVQAQGNLRSIKAAHRQQHLAAAPAVDLSAVLAASGGASRPPQLPGYCPAAASACGYPSGSPTAAVAASSSSVELPELSRSGSFRSSSRGAVTGADPAAALALSAAASSPTASGSRPGSRRRRTASGETPPPMRSPQRSSSSSCRASPRTPTGGSERGDDDDIDDAAWEAELAEFDALSRHLGVQADENTVSTRADTRPGTSATSASSAATGGASCLSSTGASFSRPASSVGKSGVVNVDPAGADGWNEGSGPAQGAVRAQRELQTCRLPLGCRVEGLFGSAGQFFFVVDVAEGPYTPATITFWIKVFDEYPEPESVSVRSVKRIFHPSVNPTTGGVEMPAERITVDGALQLQPMLHLIRQLLVTPEDAPVANAEAAALLHADCEEFRRTVRLTLNGGEYRGCKFDGLLRSGNALVSRSGSAQKDDERKPTDKLRLEMMGLEVMKDKLKHKAWEFQQQNLAEIRALEEEKG